MVPDLGSLFTTMWPPISRMNSRTCVLGRNRSSRPSKYYYDLRHRPKGLGSLGIYS